MLLYIHFPFCISKCHYCAFHSLPLDFIANFDYHKSKTKQLSLHSSQTLQVYINTLFKELEKWKDLYSHKKIETIFFGGGTPSLLPPQVIENLLDYIAKNFTLKQGLEISLEANPDTLQSKSTLQDIYKAGINRLSIGLQSLDTYYLKLLGRSHSVKHSLMAIEQAHMVGFENISIDLMWGLPSQDLGHWLKTLEQAVLMPVKHISAYSLTLEDNTKLMDSVKAGQLQLSDEQNQAEMFLQGTKLLEEYGFKQYEISNYAQSGYICKHNLGYWQGVDYLGLGPSATSTMEGNRWTNSYEHEEWEKQVYEPNFAKNTLKKASILTKEERKLEFIMLSLRTAQGLNLYDYNKLTNCDFTVEYEGLINALLKDKLININNTHINLTKRGMLVSNSILEYFLT